MDERIFRAEDGIDEEACVGILDNSSELYRMVLDTFCNELKKTCAGMKDYYAAGDIENYRILVHGLKGAGGSAGARHLVEMATESNDLIKKGKWEQAKELHEPIMKEMERLSVLIPERLGESAV